MEDVLAGPPGKVLLLVPADGRSVLLLIKVLEDEHRQSQCLRRAASAATVLAGVL